MYDARPLKFCIPYRLLFHALFILLLTGSTVWAQQQKITESADRRTMVAVRMSEDEFITLDGRLEEPVWQRAQPATDFVQQDPVHGGTPTEGTEVRIVFDRHRFYMGVICFDSEPDKLLGNTMKRDEFLRGDDRFMWVIDTFLDARTGYFFEMNPSGLMGDSLMGTGGSSERAWDGIWNARVRRSEIGWTIEIEIPFRTLNFDPSGSVWGINFQRTIRRKNEENLWTGHARNQGLRHLPSAGLVTGLTEVSQGIGLDVKPYVVARGSSAPGRDVPAFTGEADVGVDLFYNLTSGLRANFTLNTDFAQTEVDQRLVNLTRFPLFFPEKRDFFLEGSNFFGFSREPGNAIVPFFSRRIGLDEDGNPTKIIYGIKLTGQVGAYDVGVLHVRTGDEGAVSGEDFTVVRTRRRFYLESYVGMILTRRAMKGSSLPDFYTSGVDFELATSHFLDSENLRFSGFWLRNNTPSKSGKGAAWGLRLDYPNDPWSWRLNFREAQPDYNPAVGFTARSDYRRYHPVMRFSSRPSSHRYIRRISFEAWNELLTDTRNNFIHREHRLSLFELELHSGDTLELLINPKRERLDGDFRIHPGVVLPAGNEYGFTRYAVQISTGSRRKVSGTTSYEWGEFYSGRRRQFEASLSLRPRPGLFASLEGEWNRVELAEGQFSTAVLQAVADTQFSPWVSLENTIQYDTVSRVLGWQFRFRWILRPGSDLYLVYLHNWIDQFSSFTTLDRSIATKFVYTHRF